ncbi:MAG: hypothetical protein WEA54_06575 [Actinomycetota bacterium]
MTDEPGKRRIDRIREPSFAQSLDDLPLEELRERRDDCRLELEYVSLLRRLLQGRAEILKAEIERRDDDTGGASLVERLSDVLSGDEHPVSSRGAAVQVGVPDEELALARRRIERLWADAGVSDPTDQDRDELEKAIDVLVAAEKDVSADRTDVIAVLDRLQEELKRRYRDDPSLVLS